MKTLTLIFLFALMQSIGAAEPAKTAVKSTGRFVTRTPVAPIAYSDAPLPPAPGMTTWQPGKVQAKKPHANIKQVEKRVAVSPTDNKTARLIVEGESTN